MPRTLSLLAIVIATTSVVSAQGPPTGTERPTPPLDTTTASDPDLLMMWRDRATVIELGQGEAKTVDLNIVER